MSADYESVSQMFPMDDASEMPPAEETSVSFSRGVGKALHAQRRRAGLSMRALAERSGVSQPFLSQVENGHTSPSLSSLYRLAEALNLSPGDLMPATTSREVSVTRSDEGVRVPASSHPQSAIARVIASGAERGLEFIEYRVEPGAHLDEWFEFTGELVVYVIEGQLEVEVEHSGTWQLGPREAIHHDAAIRHRWRPLGDKPVSLVFAAVRN